MTAKKTEEKVEPTETTAKLYDVFDGAGNLLNIYKDKKVADVMAAKASGRKVVPSPKGRTREDVEKAVKKSAAERLADMAGPEVPEVKEV